MKSLPRLAILSAAILWAGVLTATAEPKSVFNSPCACVEDGQPCQGSYRWAVKTEKDQPPATLAASRHVIPSKVGTWSEPTANLKLVNAPRYGREKWWYELTGVVTLIKAEEDGDLHVQVVDAANTNSVQVVVEIPQGEPWCAVRKEIFSWTKRTFPFNAGNAVTLTNQPVIKVTGRAFFDGEHAGGAHADNRRDYDANMTIWEIHPVMKLEVVH